MPPSSDVAVREVRDLGLSDAGLHVVRAADDAVPPRFTGHAAVFDSRTAIGNPLRWGWYEEIDRGAFADTLAEPRVCMLVDHDTSLLVSRIAAGDLSLSTDATGLATDSELDQELSYVRDLTRNLDRGRITGMSFGFRVIDDVWTIERVSTSDGQEAEVEVRRILKVELFEVSAVTFPAYEATDAGLRSLAIEVRRAAGRPELAPAHDSPAAGGDTERPTRGSRTSHDAVPGVAGHLDRRASALSARFRLPKGS
jgi:HK97 family phage prohead protease